MHACETGTKEMVELLFERGAKVYYPAEQHSLRINNKKASGFYNVVFKHMK